MDPELKVKFKGDLTEWSASIAKAKADLSSLSVGINGTITSQNRFGKSTSDSARANNQLIASMNSLGRKMTEVASQTTASTTAIKKNGDAIKENKANAEQASGGLSTLAKGYLTLGAAMAAGRIFLDSTKEVQQFENQLKVASGTQESYGKNIQFLEGLAQKYNKNVLDLGANFAQLTIATRGTNLEGAKTERLFAAVTATSAALQMSVDDTNGTFRAFIQMVSKGNVQAEELRGQLGERLYGAFNLAAQSMGKSTSELNKMLESGEVLASDLLPKLTTELERTFGADAEKNAKNLGSAIEYATGQITVLIAELGKSSGTTSFLSQAAADAGNLLNQLRLVNKEKGVTGVVLGLMDNAAETLLNGTGFQGPTLKRARELQKSVNWQGANSSKITGQGNVINSLTGEYRDTSFGLPSSIGSTSAENPAAKEKAKKAAEAAARKAEVQMNKWVSEQIKLSNDRLRDGLLESSAQIQAKFRTNNGTLGAIGKTRRSGTELKYDYGSDQFRTEFANQTKGDGSAINYDGIVAGMDSTIKRVEEKYREMQNSISDGMKERLENLNAELSGIMSNFGAQLGVGIGEAIGEALATGGGSLESAAHKFGLMIAGLLSDLGKALISFATMVLVSEATISNPAVALAAGIAAVAAGAYLKSKLNQGEAQGFYTGGIVRGPAGVDSVNTRLSPGEMVLTKNQQSRMFGVLDGAYSGKSFDGGHGSSSSRGGQMNGQLSTVISGSDLAVVVKLGEQKNAKFK